MALDKATLKADLKDILNVLKTNEDIEDSIEVLADGLSTVFFDFVKTGEVQIGQTVSTTGTAAAQTGTVTSKGVII
jgi:hypothetical protein